MELEWIRQILRENDFIHTSGTPEEKQVAENLRGYCEKLGVPAHLEGFPVQMAQVHEAELTVNGESIPCKGYKLCGSSEIEAPFVYLPNTDKASLARARDSIVMVDTGMRYFLYQDLLENGARGFITYDGNINYADSDIDFKELRPYVSMGKLIPGVSINAKEARKLVESRPETVKLLVRQDEFPGESNNVVAEIKGKTDELIVLTAHYDTTPLSRGQYDNLTGCIALLGVMEAVLRTGVPRYTLRFVFCGSEERGLLGSKAYVQAYEAELKKTVLNINLDMLGTVMGRFIACVSAEEKLVHYIEYMSAEMGWGMSAKQGVYSSDSTPFADKGVPAVSFARLTTPTQSNIHSRYDTADVLSAQQLSEDIGFVSAFAKRMAYAAFCPVDREIPDKVKGELDEYLNRKRKKKD